MATQPTPSLDDQPSELWRWTATSLAHGIRTRAISSREATLACLQRIEQVNPSVNALVEVSPEEALEAADAADRAVADGAALGALHGVPVSIKVNSDQRGHATTNGVVAFKDLIATEDGPHVANLRNAGAVFVGRSNTPAFSFRWFTGSTGSVFHDPALQSALQHTLLLAAITVVISVPLGVTLALGLQRWRGRGSGTVNTMMLLPLVTPEIVMGVALLLLFLKVFPGIGLGTKAQAIGQVTFTLSYVVVIVRGRLVSIGREYEEAAERATA